MDPVELPPMREYQEVDTGLLVKRRRNIIGHIMGLGKTRIAIECCYRTQVQRILVVVPNKLKRNFAREINKWYPEAPVTIAAGDLAHKMFAITTFDAGFLIVPIETCRPVTAKVIKKCKEEGRDLPFDFIPQLLRIKWDAVIFDEAHRYANRNSLQTQGAFKLAHSKVPYVWPMSGTPWRKACTDIWSLLKIVAPKKFTSFWDFAQRHANARPGFFGWQMEEKAVDEAALAAEVEPFMVRREEVLTLPRQEYDIWVDLEGEQERMYREMESDMCTKVDDERSLVAMNVVSQIMRLKQLAVCPQLVGHRQQGAKLEALWDILDGTDEKVLIFSQFAELIKLISEKLSSATARIPGYGSDARGAATKHRVIIGGMRDEDVERAQDDFQNDPRVQILLGTTQAMGEGLTLTAAKVVVLMDRLWVPDDEEQAIKRADRPGQTGTVRVVRIKTEDTVEEWIDDLLSSRNVNNAAIYSCIKRRLAERYGERP